MTTTRPAEPALARLIDEFETIRREMLALVDDSSDLLEHVHPQHADSARNLLHYLALRGRDLRPLQARLAEAGLSSLGRAESHVLAAVETVLSVLQRLAGRVPPASEITTRVDMSAGQRMLHAHTEAALGPMPSRGVAIMVTMPSEAADDYALVMKLVKQGMDCARINCAHDSVERWTSMIEHLERAQQRCGRSIKILMDLAGPKVRTGPMEPGPAVVKIRPKRDVRGRVVDPARVWLFSENTTAPPPTSADAMLPVPDTWLRQLQCDDVLRCEDARRSSRSLRIVAIDKDGCWAECKKTCYVESGTTLRIERDDASDLAEPEAKVGQLPNTEMPIELSDGDELFVTRCTVPGARARRDRRGHLLKPATVGCTADQIFEDVRAGDRIWFDDGKIGGVVERREKDRLRVKITRARARGARLGSEKGINLPDTQLRLPALTKKDRSDLNFVASHADLVAFSFVNSADDVRELRELLAPLGDKQPAIVLKIETRRGFENLPTMLLEAMKSPRCAVMIARGDLAVECGFERMAEVQEEILWLCEAAHVPVIWATQVLETLAKQGIPSRAEVTDAAMAHRAECVMLNKGPYVVQAVKVLDDILERMRGHQVKKRPMLRKLRLVSTFHTARRARRAAPRAG